MQTANKLIISVMTIISSCVFPVFLIKLHHGLFYCHCREVAMLSYLCWHCCFKINRAPGTSVIQFLSYMTCCGQNKAGSETWALQNSKPHAANRIWRTQWHETSVRFLIWVPSLCVLCEKLRQRNKTCCHRYVSE